MPSIASGGSTADSLANRSPARCRQVVGLYGNQPLSVDSSLGVPRVLARLLQWLAEVFPAVEVNAFSPGGEIQGVNMIPIESTMPPRLRRRIAGSRLRPRRVDRVETTLEFERFSGSRQRLAVFSSRDTVVICTTFVACMLARRFVPRAKIVYWIHSLPRLGHEAVAVQAINSADAIVVPSRAIYDALFELACRDSFVPPVWIVPNCVDLDVFAPLSAAARQLLRSSYNIGADEIVIRQIGREPEKGLQVIEAALRSRPPSQQTTLITTGGSQPTERSIADHVRQREFGRVPMAEMVRLYQICDLGVVPSVWWENFPAALMEMMASALPAIASHVGGIGEMVDHDTNGLLVDAPNIVDGWSAALDRMLGDAALRHRLGQQARHCVAERYDRGTFTSRWVNVIESVLSDG